MLKMFYLLLSILVAVILYHKWTNRHISKIPGPPSWFLVGNIFQMLGSPEHVWSFFQKQNKLYPIYKISNGIIQSVHLNNPNDIEMILSSKKHLRKTLIYDFLHAWLGTGLLTSDGNKWHSRRKLLTPAFHFNIVHKFFESFSDHSTHLVDLLQDECKKPFTEISPLITQFTLHTICETAMGTKLNEKKKENEKYVTATFKMGLLIIKRIRRPWLYFDPIYQFTAMGKQQSRLINTLHNFTTSVIEERKQNFTKSNLVSTQLNDFQFKSKNRFAMLDLLLSVQKDGVNISDEGIREEVDTFMFEGHDTTSGGISFALLLLANHPKIQEKVLEEINNVMNHSDCPFTLSDIQQLSYLQLVIKESLRIYPSVPFIARKLDDDIITSTGYFIPKNTIVCLHIYGLHHNPKFYPNPEKFNPDRFLPENTKDRHPFSYIPFSAGSRNCIGQKFAMVEMKTAIASIIRNFVVTPVDTPDDISLIAHLVLKTKDGIKLKFRKRT